jgi:hypothetical protein
MKANQAKIKANRKADQEHMQDMLARMDASRKDDKEEMKEDLLVRLGAKTEANQANMDVKLKAMSEEIKGQEEMKLIVNAIWSESEDVNHKMQDLRKEVSDIIEKRNRQNYRQRCPSIHIQGSSRITQQLSDPITLETMI